MSEVMWDVHDNIILSYQVDFENETLIIKTLYDDNKIREKIDVIFTGYLTHIFENEMKDNIILSIDESSCDRFIEDEQEFLIKQKNNWWPIKYETQNDLSDYLQDNCYKAYIIYASLGLSGWVLAKNTDFVKQTNK